MSQNRGLQPPAFSRDHPDRSLVALSTWRPRSRGPAFLRPTPRTPHRAALKCIVPATIATNLSTALSRIHDGDFGPNRDLTEVEGCKCQHGKNLINISISYKFAHLARAPKKSLRGSLTTFAAAR